jgi:hypothetical protein
MRRRSSRWSELKGAVSIDAGVVDEDVRVAELVLDAAGGGEDRCAVGDVGLDGDRAVAELVDQGLDAVGAAREQRDAVAVGGQCAGGRLADARRGARDDGDAAGALIGAHAVTSSSASDEERSR